MNKNFDMNEQHVYFKEIEPENPLYTYLKREVAPSHRTALAQKLDVPEDAVSVELVGSVEYSWVLRMQYDFRTDARIIRGNGDIPESSRLIRVESPQALKEAVSAALEKERQALQDTVLGFARAYPEEPPLPLEQKDGQLWREHAYRFGFVETCPDCDGRKKLVCPRCHGEARWRCTGCAGKEQVVCESCSGKGGTVCASCGGHGVRSCPECSGKGNVSCGNCGGTGERPDPQWVTTQCTHCTGTGWASCPRCQGPGTIKCDKCRGSGGTQCRQCDGKGRSVCRVCSGEGIESCGKCGGQGTILCNTCSGEGKLHSIGIVQILYSAQREEFMPEAPAEYVKKPYDYDRSYKPLKILAANKTPTVVVFCPHSVVTSKFAVRYGEVSDIISVYGKEAKLSGLGDFLKACLVEKASDARQDIRALPLMSKVFWPGVAHVMQKYCSLAPVARNMETSGFTWGTRDKNTRRLIRYVARRIRLRGTVTFVLPHIFVCLLVLFALNWAQTLPEAVWFFDMAAAKFNMVADTMVGLLHLDTPGKWLLNFSDKSLHTASQNLAVSQNLVASGLNVSISHVADGLATLMSVDILPFSSSPGLRAGYVFIQGWIVFTLAKRRTMYRLKKTLNNWRMPKYFEFYSAKAWPSGVLICFVLPFLSYIL